MTEKNGETREIGACPILKKALTLLITSHYQQKLRPLDFISSNLDKKNKEQK